MARNPTPAWGELFEFLLTVARVLRKMLLFVMTVSRVLRNELSFGITVSRFFKESTETFE